MIDSNAEERLVELAGAICKLNSDSRLPVTAERKTFQFRLEDDGLVFRIEGEDGDVFSVGFAVGDSTLALSCATADADQFLHSAGVVSLALQAMHEMGCAFDYELSMGVAQGVMPGESKVISVKREDSQIEFLIDLLPLLDLPREGSGGAL